MTGTYPRDMVGYGANPPLAKWPGKARVALQFVCTRGASWDHRKLGKLG